MQKINAQPVIYQKRDINREVDFTTFDDNFADEIDSKEIYDLIRNITDPEHPLTLEQLNVAQLDHVSVDDKANYILIEFTPTIPHCSMATLIGLSIRVCLIRNLPSRFKIDVKVRPGSHNSESAINKQLNDKERVSAALENSNLLEVVNQCLSTVY